ncbi:MAG: hypothetical protein AAGD05_12595, partial [Bacteroidota bacterium]
MDLKYIQASGTLLATYYTDLCYLQNFQKYKAGQLSEAQYLSTEPGMFKKFLNEFRVARNV